MLLSCLPLGSLSKVKGNELRRVSYEPPRSFLLHLRYLWTSSIERTVVESVRTFQTAGIEMPTLQMFRTDPPSKVCRREVHNIFC